MDLNPSVKRICDACTTRTLGSRSWLFAVLDAPGIFDRSVAALWCRVGEGPWPQLHKRHGSVPRSSEIQDLYPRWHPEAVAPQYHPKDIFGFFSPAVASSLCEQPFWGSGCSSGRFGGSKTPPVEGGSWAQPLLANTEVRQLIQATSEDGLFKL